MKVLVPSSIDDSTRAMKHILGENIINTLSWSYFDYKMAVCLFSSANIQHKMVTCVYALKKAKYIEMTLPF